MGATEVLALVQVSQEVIPTTFWGMVSAGKPANKVVFAILVML